MNDKTNFSQVNDIVRKVEECGKIGHKFSDENECPNPHCSVCMFGWRHCVECGANGEIDTHIESEVKGLLEGNQIAREQLQRILSEKEQLIKRAEKAESEVNILSTKLDIALSVMNRDIEWQYEEKVNENINRS